jgi:hypothetical protein
MRDQPQHMNCNPRIRFHWKRTPASSNHPPIPHPSPLRQAARARPSGSDPTSSWRSRAPRPCPPWPWRRWINFNMSKNTPDDPATAGPPGRRPAPLYQPATINYHQYIYLPENGNNYFYFFAAWQFLRRYNALKALWKLAGGCRPDKCQNMQE